MSDTTTPLKLSERLSAHLCCGDGQCRCEKLVADVAALEARAEKAERERDAWKAHAEEAEQESFFYQRAEHLARERYTAERQRNEAEAKLDAAQAELEKFRALYVEAPEPGEDLSQDMEHEAIDALVAWVKRSKAECKAKGTVFDDVFRCVDEGGTIWEFDPENIEKMHDALAAAQAREGKLREAKDRAESLLALCWDNECIADLHDGNCSLGGTRLTHCTCELIVELRAVLDSFNAAALSDAPPADSKMPTLCPCGDQPNAQACPVTEGKCTKEEIVEDNARLQEFVEDLAKNGLRYELNPTQYIGPDADRSRAWWQRRFGQADQDIRRRAREALARDCAGFRASTAEFSAMLHAAVEAERAACADAVEAHFDICLQPCDHTRCDHARGAAAAIRARGAR